MSRKKNSFKKQNDALRDPQEIVSSSFAQAGINASSLEFSTDKSFIDTLEKQGITLLITREYEHLVMGLCAKKKKLHQSFISLPHPSGIAVDRQNNSVYVAATRNPNQVVELKPASAFMHRDGNKRALKGNFLLPSRIKFFPGSTYLHDLAFIGNDLYGNTVGQNGIMRIDLSSASTDRLCWTPLCVKGKTGANHLQLNSIAAGPTVSTSFFSASVEKPLPQKPGHPEFPVDGTGVIFSGKTGKACARGLTRPHSARLYKGKLYVNNSGYGEFGKIEAGTFVPLVKLPGWTRGLCFHGHIAFIGVSRIIPQFKMYAPGLKGTGHLCGVFAFDMNTEKILGSLTWPNGNQVFGVEWIDRKVTEGFMYEQAGRSSELQQDVFSRFLA